MDKAWWACGLHEPVVLCYVTCKWYGLITATVMQGQPPTLLTNLIGKEFY